MPLNMEKVRNKLSSFDKTKKGGKKVSSETQEKIKKYIWKPEPGKQIVRIVPYQYQPDFPFIELKFHYNFNGDNINYLSPSSINKPDPIVELANRLEKVKETWLKGRKMQPKLRTYVPIIVRGKEEEGVKFWGFGVQVCEQLMSAINEPDYGDITDLNNGYDIQVDFKTAEEVKKDFPETKILIKPKPRPVIDPEHSNVRAIMELITNKQPNIFDIYTPANYDDLVVALESKIESERNGISMNSSPRGSERTTNNTPRTLNDDDTVVLPTEKEINDSVSQFDKRKSVSNNEQELSEISSPSNEKSKKVKIDDFEKAFQDVFSS